MGMGGLAAAAGGAMTGWALRPATDRGTREAALKRVRLTGRALGTRVTMTALHESPEDAAAAIGQAFAEIDRVEQVLSLYRPDSQLCVLNREGGLEAAHPYLLTVLHEARAMSQATRGAFDVTVQPLWQVYAAAQAEGRLPSPGELEAARRKVDWRAVRVDGGSVRLVGDGRAVTLNGIAQGFAADRAMAVLRGAGVRHALIDTGEFAAVGAADGGEGAWRIGVRDPRRADALVSAAALRDRCLATSADDATAFSADRRHNHLFDPHTGLSPTDFASVSVVAETAMQADALSTAVYVMGIDRGMKLIADTPGADALVVRKDGSISATPGFPAVHSA